MKKYVAYLRVSTSSQGASGLGLEAQRSAVSGFVRGKDVLIAEYVEVETGKNNNRVQLNAAIAFAQQNKATLLIAKLDRLSRNAAFIFTLRDTGVDFIAVDMPDANSLTIGIFAVIAQAEREAIAKRTRDALAAKRARGEQLGTLQNLTPEGRVKGRIQRTQNARNNKANLQARQLIKLLGDQGLSLSKIADTLNDSGYTTRRGCRFTPTAVRRLKSGLSSLTTIQPVG